jgi:hypothetical protein
MHVSILIAVAVAAHYYAYCLLAVRVFTLLLLFDTGCIGWCVLCCAVYDVCLGLMMYSCGLVDLCCPMNGIGPNDATVPHQQRN